MAKTWWADRPRWSLLYGKYEGLEAFALRELQRTLQGELPYVIPVVPATGDLPADRDVVLVGTLANNPRLAELAALHLLEFPPVAGGYGVHRLGSPWHPQQKVLAIVGHDPQGVLYGVMDFNSRYPVLQTRWNDPVHRLRAFNELPEFGFTDFPRITHRGIWTWGYVIYDYRGYLDHMARLRMNELIVWNDAPPLNAREVIEYAHARGIRIVFGFHWGWAVNSPADLLDPAKAGALKADIVGRYHEGYRDLGLDGIYFQSVTEHHEQTLGGRSLAAVMCDFVNDVAHTLLEAEPHLSIQFGLHATSIREHYRDLAALDPRVTITWEDAGGLPYTYDASVEYRRGGQTLTFEDTLAFSRQLATFRPGTCFAMVPKGWTNLDWGEEFEHHGPFILGEQGRGVIHERWRRCRPVWERRDRAWLQHYSLAARFYREILACQPASTLVAGLIEDGLFEAEVALSASLFAQTIWNPERDDAELLRFAASPYCLRRNEP